MQRALILLGHSASTSLGRALAENYRDGFRSHGAEATLLDLAQLRFDPVLRPQSDRQHILEPDLVAAQSALLAADHLVWVFPIYWGNLPALVKGFVDRVLLPGFAYRYDGKSLPTGLLKGKSSRVITTMDSPRWWYWLMHRGAAHATLNLATLAFVGVSPRTSTTFYEVRKSSAGQREGYLRRVFTQGRRDAQKRHSGYV